MRCVITTSTIIKFVSSKIKIRPTQNSEKLNSKSESESESEMLSNHNSRDLMSNRTSSVHRDSIHKNDIDLVDHCVDRGREGGSEGNGDTDINRPHSGVIRGFGGYKNEVYEAVSTAFLGLGLVGGEFFNRGEGGRVKSHSWLI